MNKKAISKNYIDENKVRLVAAQVVIVTVVILYRHYPNKCVSSN